MPSSVAGGDPSAAAAATQEDQSDDDGTSLALPEPVLRTYDQKSIDIVQHIAKLRSKDPSSGRPRPALETGWALLAGDPRKIRAWRFPPSAQKPVQASPMSIIEGRVFGTIKAFEHTASFASCQIMHPDFGDDVWVNVWTCVNNQGLPRGVDFCQVIRTSRKYDDLEGPSPTDSEADSPDEAAGGDPGGAATPKIQAEGDLSGPRTRQNHRWNKIERAQAADNKVPERSSPTDAPPSVEKEAQKMKAPDEFEPDYSADDSSDDKVDDNTEEARIHAHIKAASRPDMATDDEEEMIFLRHEAEGDLCGDHSASAKWVTQCDFCGYTNFIGRTECSVCHRRIIQRGEATEKVAMDDIRERLGLHVKTTIRGKNSVTSMERKNAKKIVKKALRKNYNSISEYFARDETFRNRKRSEGWTRDTIGQLDERANVEAQSLTVRKSQRAKFEKDITVADSSAGGSDTVPLRRPPRDRPAEWSSEAWDTWASWSSSHNPGWSWERR